MTSSRSSLRQVLRRHPRECGVATVILVLAVVLATTAPAYFSAENLSDLFLASLPPLIVAIGMTLVILTGEIDISVGSTFAVCSVLAGVMAKAGWPMPVVIAVACTCGGGIGALNGTLVAYLRLPSIVVTLATMVALRDSLRWITQGAWVSDLPASFQWFGMSQKSYPWIALTVAIVLFTGVAWAMRHIAAGRMVYATGSNEEAARQAGIDTAAVETIVFVIAGALTGVAAILNAVRFNQIPANGGLGLELSVIAAVVVGGASIRGGEATFTGTLLGVVLLAAIGPALTFLGVNAYWERAIQGAIILGAVALDAVGAQHPQAAGPRHASALPHPRFE